MEHWIKYKSIRLNLGQVKTLHAHRATKGTAEYSEAPVSKDKMWILSADYQDLDAFPDKTSAMAVADRMIAGDYDCK